MKQCVCSVPVCKRLACARCRIHSVERGIRAPGALGGRDVGVGAAEQRVGCESGHPQKQSPSVCVCVHVQEPSPRKDPGGLGRGARDRDHLCVFVWWCALVVTGTFVNRNAWLRYCFLKAGVRRARGWGAVG